MGKLSDKLSGLKKIFANKKLVIYLSVAVLSIIAIMIFSSSFTKTTSKPNTSSSVTQTNLNYAENLESRIENLICSVSGVTSAKVVVYVESSTKKEYLTNSAGDVVTTKDSSGTCPVVVQETLPKITGILICYGGTKDVATKNNILRAISSTFNVDISKIDILEGK